MNNYEAYLANYATTLKARNAALWPEQASPPASTPRAAKRKPAAAGAQQYPKGRCLVRGLVTDVYYSPQHLYHEARLQMRVQCGQSGIVVFGAIPHKLQKPRVKRGDTVQFIATFPEFCTSTYCYFMRPCVADSRYDLVDCFTKARGVK